jgi:hypothetical protein
MPIREILTIEGGKYSLQNVAGDGDCFFHCISVALHGSSDFRRASQLRNRICTHVFLNWEEFESDVHLCHNTSLTKPSYLDFMLKKRNWATACEVKAASELLQLSINVFLLGSSGGRPVYTKS